MNNASRLSSGLLKKVLLVASAGTLFFSQNVTVEARNTSGYIDLATGITNIISPISPLGIDKAAPEVIALANAESSSESSADDTEEEEESKLFMANVSLVMNVREEPNEDSTKVGVIYKDCGGKILDRKDGWTKVQSGDLVGWANDEYLLFGDEAKALAEDVGKQIVTSNSSALHVRAEASTDAEVLGVLTENTFVDYIEDAGDGWIAVDYNDETGYVQSEYVSSSFKIDTGETIAAIKLREEAEKKNSLTKNRGAVSADADEVKLLAALIQCEAGNQPYEGKVAVGAVVMNRVKSGAYPSSIYGVIYASGQFTPALNGTVAKVYNSGKISDSNYQAAQAAINGETTVGSALHFRRVNGRDGIIIGAHVFW